MSRLKKHIIIVMAVAMLAASCGSVQQKDKLSARAQADIPVLPQLSHNDSLRYKLFYFEAVRQQLDGNYDQALDLLNHCLTINPNAAEAYYLRSMYTAALKNDSLAMDDVKKAAALSPRNNTYLERLATGYVQTKNYPEAIAAYEKLSRNQPDRAEILNALTALYGQQKDYDNMIKTLNRLEELEGSSEQTMLAKMSAYAMKGDKTAELNTLKSMADQHPNDLNYRVMLGNWLLQHGHKQEAYKEYSEVLAVEPDNNMAQMSMIDYYRADNQTQRADSVQEAMLVSRKTPFESKVTLMRQVVDANEKSGGDSTHVIKIFKKILRQPQETSDMAGLYVAYMMLKNMPKDSIAAALDSALVRFPDDLGIRLQRIQIAWEKEDWAGVERLARQGIDYKPDEMVLYYYLGFSFVFRDDDDEALKALRDGVRWTKDDSNPDIVGTCYSVMGDIYYQKGKPQEAFAAYDSCLQWQPDNYPCLNNYAYYLSENGRQLKKAEQMSYRTIQAEPDNSTYLDTYAWILFKQKKYKEAQPFIDMAVKNDTTKSATVIEHAGDIHAVNGDIQQALTYWRMALKLSDDDNKVLIRKIKLKKYIDEK